MSHFKMWYQGRAPFQALKCDGKPEFTCPESKRVAAEYMRDYFTLTNVLNPNIHYDNMGVETWLHKELRDVVVGDYLWLVLVPPMHKVIDVFAYNAETETEGSGYATMDGITLSLVTAKFSEADENGDCEMESDVEVGSLVMAGGKQVFVQEDTDGLVTDTETWVGVGLKVDALPKNTTLADIYGKIVVGCHALGYDAQTFM